MPMHKTIAELENSSILAAPTDSGPIEMIVRRPAVDERETLESGVLDTDVVSVWMRGSEICHRESLEGFPGTVEIAGESCQTPSEFSIPDVLVADVVIVTEESDLPVGGAVFGHVTEAADRLVISFESGEAIVIEPGERVEFGLRGYGLPYFDVTLLGEPTTIEVYSGDQVLGVYSHTEGRDVSG
jgi:hypothetical protein